MGEASQLTLPTGRGELCISVAARPSRFGVTVHNAGYRALGLDFFYKALGIDNIEKAVASVRALGLRGCSVSMPFKENVIDYLDELDPLARRVGAVNTILNEGGKLKGFNTDVAGAKTVLGNLAPASSDRVILLGSGGVARAIVVALQEIGIKEIQICSRRPQMAQEFCLPYLPWAMATTVEGDLLINATPIGMAPDQDSMPVTESAIKPYKLVMDVVATPPVSKLVAKARQMKKITIDGFSMTLYQAAAQFKIYTGFDAPMKEMREAALELITDEMLIKHE